MGAGDRTDPQGTAQAVRYRDVFGLAGLGGGNGAEAGGGHPGRGLPAADPGHLSSGFEGMEALSAEGFGKGLFHVLVPVGAAGKPDLHGMEDGGAVEHDLRGRNQKGVPDQPGDGDLRQGDLGMGRADVQPVPVFPGHKGLGIEAQNDAGRPAVGGGLDGRRDGREGLVLGRDRFSRKEVDPGEGRVVERRGKGLDDRLPHPPDSRALVAFGYDLHRMMDHP